MATSPDFPILNVRIYEDGKTSYCEPSMITKLRGKLSGSGSTLRFGVGYSRYVLEQTIRHLPDITDNYVVENNITFKCDGIKVDEALVIKGKYIIIVIGWQMNIRIYPQGEPPKYKRPINNVSARLEADYDFGLLTVANIFLNLRPDVNMFAALT